MTTRLYYTDSYLTDFDAQVVDASADRKRVYLDGTAFYPTSGGQAFDLGQLDQASVIDVVDEGDRIAHVLSGPLEAECVKGRIDWPRRFDHMQQHTGQHLLSAVFSEMLGAETLSVHFGAESSTVDLAIPSVESAQIQAVERRANEIAVENRLVSVEFQDAGEVDGLRKASEREGLLRIVSIRDLDRSACGGTHVRATGEIGPILLRKLEKVRGSLRVEFLCGGRAVRRARSDFEVLSQIARVFSAPIDDTPSLVAAQIERLKEADKARTRLGAELAGSRGRELYTATEPGSDGVRRLSRTVEAISEDVRLEAQSFAAGSKAVLLVVAEEPLAVLLAASKDSGINAGQWLKTALAQTGGRGGGSPVLAQASLPSKEALAALRGLYSLAGG